MRRVIIDTLANGCWYGARLEHWCAGCCADRADSLHKMQTYLVAALAPCAPVIFQRQRWTKQELSIRAIGLLEGINRLFSRAYERFASRMSSGGGQERPAHTPVAAADALQDDRADAHPIGIAMLGGSDGAESVWEAQRMEQSKHRQTVCEWNSGLGPMSDLIILGRVVEILRKYTSKLLYLGVKSGKLSNRGRWPPPRGLMASTWLSGSIES